MARKLLVTGIAVIFGSATIYLWTQDAQPLAVVLAVCTSILLAGLIFESVTNLRRRRAHSPDTHERELRHGDWILRAREKQERRPFSRPSFWLLVVFSALFAGSVYLFENIDLISSPLYAVKIVVTTLFAVTLGFLLSVWWTSTSGDENKLREAERVDAEYRELLMSFSDSLFHIIHALNTLATKPPRSFFVATEFLLGQYVHMLQSRLQWYGDYVAGLGLDANAFLDEKLRIFDGIRERANLSVKGMPLEFELALIESLEFDRTRHSRIMDERRRRLREDFTDLADAAGIKRVKVSGA